MLKRITKFVAYIICAVILLSIITIILAKAYSSHEKDIQTKYLRDAKCISENFYTKCDASENDTSCIHDFIASLPKNISYPFTTDWKVIIVSEIPESVEEYLQSNNSNFGSNEENVQAFGYSSWRERLIFIRFQENNEEMYKMFVHEFGHAMDYEFGTPSTSKEFTRIFNLYKETFIEADTTALPGYAVSNHCEFFATCCKEYFLYPDHLKTEASEAYSFIDEMYNEIVSNPNANTTLKYDITSVYIILSNELSEKWQALLNR